MLAMLVSAEQPGTPVHTFADPDDAERWLAGAPVPVMVLADVAASGGATLAGARTWRDQRSGLVLVAMFDANVEEEVTAAAESVVDASIAKPCCRAAWAKAFQVMWAASSLPD